MGTASARQHAIPPAFVTFGPIPPTMAHLMLTKLLKAKIHRATVTFTDVNYHGSITIDTDLLRATGLMPNEAVMVADCENGNRFETYIIPGEAGSGTIAVNGAAARLTQLGHKLIILSYVLATPAEVASHASRVVIVDGRNRVIETIEHKTVQ
jgi:aspartate 1-decarboxylase